MTKREKKELLQDFLNECWQRNIYLFEEKTLDYDYKEVKYSLQDDDEIINWYLRVS